MRDLTGITILDIDPELLQMRGDRVLLRRDPAREKTKGGILLPDATAEEGRPHTGKIVSVGPGEHAKYTGAWIPMSDDMKPGTQVVYNTYGGFEVSDECVMVSAADVIAVVLEPLEVDVDTENLEEGDLAEADEARELDQEPEPASRPPSRPFVMDAQSPDSLAITPE